MPSQRIQCVEPPYSDEVQSSYDIVMPPGMPPLNIFRTVAKNPRVLSRMSRGGLLDKGSISIAQRELVILRVCGLCRAEYEWGVHVAAFAEKSGFTQPQIAATLVVEVNADLWSVEQLAILRMVDELHENSAIIDSTWGLLSSCFSEEQLVELVMLSGLYRAVSYVVNAFEVERETFAPEFPKPDSGEA